MADWHFFKIRNVTRAAALVASLTRAATWAQLGRQLVRPGRQLVQPGRQLARPGRQLAQPGRQLEKVTARSLKCNFLELWPSHMILCFFAGQFSNSTTSISYSLAYSSSALAEQYQHTILCQKSRKLPILMTKSRSTPYYSVF